MTIEPTKNFDEQDHPVLDAAGRAVKGIAKGVAGEFLGMVPAGASGEVISSLGSVIREVSMDNANLRRQLNEMAYTISALSATIVRQSEMIRELNERAGKKK